MSPNKSVTDQNILEKLFSSDKQVIAIYLNKTGCRDYTIAMLRRFRTAQLTLVHSESSSFKEEYKTLTIPTHSSKLSFIWASLSAKRKLSKVLSTLINESRNPVIYLPAFHPWNIIIMQWAHTHSIPVYLTIHDYRTHTGEKSRLTEYIQKKCIALAHQVIFLTQYVKSQAIDDDPKNKVDVSKYNVVPHPILSAGGINSLPYNPQPRLLFLGRQVSYKGLDLLLEAIKGTAISGLTIAGSGNDKRLKKSSDPRVTYINAFLSQVEITNLLTTHEVLILPYKEASQSGIITLGISAQMVMIVTELGGIMEQVPKNGAVTCKPTVESLKAAIISLSQDPELYNQCKKTIETFALTI